MSWGVFKKVCNLCREHSDPIFIGGGEPTLHPKFFEFLGYAIVSQPYGELGEIQVGVITNGSITRSAMRLAEMAEIGLIYAGLSQDQFHDPIDERVVAAFTKKRQLDGTYKNRDHREIRKNIYNIMPAGRGKVLVDDGVYERSFTDCACPGQLVRPDGSVYDCGCPGAPSIGNIMRDCIEWNYDGECYKQKALSAKSA